MARRISGIVVLCVMGIAGFFVFAHAADSRYTVTDLGVLDGYTSSKAFGINDLGQVVGDLINGGTYSAFLWDSVHGIQLLSGLEGSNSVAVGINNNGYIIGNSNSQAVLWLGGTTPTGLGTLGGPTSTAFHINNNNQIVGWSDLPYNADFGGSLFHGFLYEFNQMKDAGTLTQDIPYWDNGYSVAYGINNQGQIAGVATSSDGYWTNHAFLREPDGTMKDLGGYPGLAYTEGQAVAINDAGLLAGHAYDNSGNSAPVVWQPGQSGSTVVAMPGEFSNGQFYDINEKGQMVGVMWNATVAADPSLDRAFLYDIAHGANDLNSLIDPGLGWELKFARSINEKGQIVGYGFFNGEGRAYVLTPVPEPISSALFLFGAGALGLRVLRRKKRA